MRTTYIANLRPAPDVDSAYEVVDRRALAWANTVMFGDDGRTLEDGPFDDGARATASLDRLVEGPGFTRIRLTHPDRDEPDITRTATIWVGHDVEGMFVRIRLGVTGDAGRLPAHVSTAPPRLVRELVDDLGVVADGRRLTSVATTLDSTAVHTDLLPLLINRERTLPVVLLTTPYNRALFPDRVARRLAGLAHVFTPGSVPTTYTITEVLGREWTAFQGAVRLYWAGLDLDGDPRQHSLLIFRDRIREDGLDRLHASLTARYSGVWSVPAQDRELDLARARSLGDDADWLAELERAIDAQADAEARVEIAYARIDALEADLETVRTDLDLARKQMGLVRQAASTGDEQADSDGDRIDPTFEPATVGDAVRQAVKESVALVFLDEALRSADASHFPKPATVLDDLRKLDQAARQWTGDGVGWKDLLQQHGLILDSGVSQTAVGLYPDDYTRTHNGDDVILGPHIRHGTKPRSGIGIYWWVDDEAQVLVVGHVGDKLRDTTNRS